ncbi:MAG: dihydropteroate synthase [Planctomycetes bacterium]|nr:dihydropteroate synthase [Planctomycetota bacterium]
MAVLNVTPDSFHEASRVPTVDAALRAAARAIEHGADMLDIGGESTRPGAGRVSDADQIARVAPVVRAIRNELGGVPISVDTTRSAVAAAAIDNGADAINDVSGATQDAGMLELAARTEAGVVLMHRLVEPERDSYSDRYASPPRYADVVVEIRSFLSARAEAALEAGVRRDGIVLDPGLGFGKAVEQNMELVRRSGELASLGYPLLCAASRKSFVGAVSIGAESSPSDRLAGSIAMSVVHRMLGASIFRVHDPREQAQALRVVWALEEAGGFSWPRVPA